MRPRTIAIHVYEFSFRTAAEADVLGTLNAEQAAGFELVSASGQPGGRVLMLFRKPQIVHSVIHAPLAAATH